MRQVPQYLIIGRGRVARHFQHYLSILRLSWVSWHREEPLDLLYQHASQSTHILLLINDGGIDQFITAHLLDTKAIRIHFSGSHVSEYAHGAHPLMTFAHALYNETQYQSIPFILDEDAPPFAALLPGFPNQHVRLPKTAKANYHALCVLSGNFSCLLWQKLFNDFEGDLGLPREIAFPYLMQQAKNLINDAEAALTGPLVRNDIETIQKNLSALADDPFSHVYRSFVTWYQTRKGAV